MPRIDGTTNAQTTFLRAFRQSPAGPPPDQWPAAAVLRRWLRRPAFQQALTCIREVLRFRAQFHIAAAANQAAQSLHNPAHDTTLTPQQAKRLLDLIRLDYLHQRFPIEDPDLVIPSKYNSQGERLYRPGELTKELRDAWDQPSPPRPPKQGVGRRQ